MSRIPKVDGGFLWLALPSRRPSDRKLSRACPSRKVLSRLSYNFHRPLFSSSMKPEGPLVLADTVAFV